MIDESDSELELCRALQIVEQKLDEAEQTLWAASADSERLNSELDLLIQELWSLQESIEEIRTDLE